MNLYNEQHQLIDAWKFGELEKNSIPHDIVTFFFWSCLRLELWVFWAQIQHQVVSCLERIKLEFE
jgi:hypothetical protein